MKSLLLALVASLGILSASSVAGAQESAGIIAVKFETGAKTAAKHNPLKGKRHSVSAPTARKVWEVQAGCTVRQLEGDASEQTVTICDGAERPSYDPDTL